MIDIIFLAFAVVSISIAVYIGYKTIAPVKYRHVKSIREVK